MFLESIGRLCDYNADVTGRVLDTAEALTVEERLKAASDGQWLDLARTLCSGRYLSGGIGLVGGMADGRGRGAPPA